MASNGSSNSALLIAVSFTTKNLETSSTKAIAIKWYKTKDIVKGTTIFMGKKTTKAPIPRAMAISTAAAIIAAIIPQRNIFINKTAARLSWAKARILDIMVCKKNKTYYLGQSSTIKHCFLFLIGRFW